MACPLVNAGSIPACRIMLAIFSSSLAHTRGTLRIMLEPYSFQMLRIIAYCSNGGLASAFCGNGAGTTLVPASAIATLTNSLPDSSISAAYKYLRACAFLRMYL